MSKIINVSLLGSNAVHGQPLGADTHATLCRPAGGKGEYALVRAEVTCRSCAKIIRESAPVVESAPEPVAVANPDTPITRALENIRYCRAYVDNSGNSGVGDILRDLLSRGLVRVNGASRTILPNGRTGRRIVLTIAGRNALNV